MNISFSSTTLQFWSLFLVAIITLIWVFKLSWGQKNVRALIYLRILIFSSLLLLLLNPKLSHTFNESRPLKWHVYLDRSLSIDYHGNPTKLALERSLEKMSKQFHQENPDLEIHYFSNTIYDDVEKMKSPHGRSSTDLGLVIKQIKENEASGLNAGAIIISDGQATQGIDPLQLTDEINTSIYCIGVGEATPMVDLSIESMDFPPVAIIDEEVKMDIVISSFGNLKERVDVTLYQAKKLVGSKVIMIGGEGSQQKISFRVKPSALGNLTYHVKVSALEDEINILNNRQSMNLKVLKSKYHIAILTGAPNYNTGPIKDILQKNKRFELDHFVYTRNNFSPLLKDFWKKSYDLIILDNHPISENVGAWKSLSSILAKKIISQKSALLFISGPETSEKTFNLIKPLMNVKSYTHFLEEGRKNKWTFTDTLHSIFPFDYQRFMEMNERDWPPLVSGLEINGKNQMVIAQYKLPSLSIPILSLGESKGLRYGIWTSPDLYQLHYKLLSTDRSEMFSSLWNGVFSWLMKTGGDQEYFFRMDKKSYQQGEEVIVTGMGGDERYDTFQGQIRLYQNGEWIEDQSLSYDIKTNQFHGKYWTSTSGNFAYEI